MTRSALIKEICQKNRISISELARRIGQTPQNLNKKIMRNTVSDVEWQDILSHLHVEYKQIIKFNDGTTFEASNDRISL